MQLAESLPQIHKDITPKRLAIIAKMVRQVWVKVRKNHQPKVGDTMWGFGTRFHERMCYALRQAAERYSWLRLVERRLHFVFTIGEAPVRFYRGYADRPKKGYLHRRQPEMKQQKLAGIDLDWCCRIAIEASGADSTPDIIFVQHSETTGAQRNAWRVTDDGKSEAVPVETLDPTQAALPLSREAAPIGPPSISRRKKTAKAQASGDGT